MILKDYKRWSNDVKIQPCIIRNNYISKKDENIKSRMSLARNWESVCVLPELDRLHVFSAKSLKLGCHWLFSVPESFSICFWWFGLWNLNPELCENWSKYWMHVWYIFTLKANAIKNNRKVKITNICVKSTKSNMH